MVSRILAFAKKVVLKLYAFTNPIGYARTIGVKVGEGCRIFHASFDSEPYLITIGNHVTLTDVSFITHDGGVWIFREKYPDINLFGPINIGNNVFVGLGVIILPNVTIGDNCVIGAGAVVTKNIPPNSVAVGVPARVIETVDEYYRKIESKCIHNRSLSDKEKRKMLIERFS